MRVLGSLGRWSALGGMLLAGAWLGCALAGGLADESGPVRTCLEVWARGEELEAERLTAFRRVEARCQIIREVAEGRIGLAEARRRRAALLREWPGYESIARDLNREEPEEQRLNRQIMEEVRFLLAGRPGKAGAVLRALEQELREGRRGGGGVRAGPARAEAR
jgi:hypothetical protein